MKKTISIGSACLAAILVLALCASCSLQQKNVGTNTDETESSVAVQALGTQGTIEVDDTDATAIVFQADTVSVSGEGASADGANVQISSGGVYTVRGMTSDGSIVVNAPDADVTIILDGAHITCTDSSAIYVYSAKKATVYAKPDTENTLTDGQTYAYDGAYASKTDEEPNACLYSKADLILAGSGKLTVNGNAANGVTSKDTLLLDALTLTVSAANNGVTGKDSLTVNNANVTVNAQGDALRSTNDTDDQLGYVAISGATLDLTSGEDGIQAQTCLTLGSTTAKIVSGGGSGAKVSDDVSAKAVKAGTDITIDGGTCTFDCADDAVHADGNVTVNSGTLTIETGDDGIHADNTVTIRDGKLQITAHEGIEATLVTIDGGEISIKASDDGINAAKKTDGATPTVTINGGTLDIEMGQGDTDGIDANGDIIINGGTIRVTGQSAFDYDGKAELNGGEVYVNGEKVTELENQFGGMGGGKQGGFPGSFSGERPDGTNGELPELPNGERPQRPNSEDGQNDFFPRGGKERTNDAGAQDDPGSDI